MQITLPWPPTVNTYWRHAPIRYGRGVVVYISKAGRAYRKTVGKMVLEQDAYKILTCRLSCLILASPPDARKRDLDNILKALLDAMEHAGVYENDEQIDDLHVLRAPPMKGGQVVVCLEECTRLHGHEPAQEELLA